jgi:hypothetical protein
MRTPLILLLSLFITNSVIAQDSLTKTEADRIQVAQDLLAILQLERFDRLPGVIHPQTDAEAFKDSMSEYQMRYDEKRFAYTVTFYEDETNEVAMSGTYNYEYTWPKEVRIDILVKDDTALTTKIENRIELALNRAYDVAEHHEDGHMIWEYNGPECYRMIHLDTEDYQLEKDNGQQVGKLQEITLEYECDRLNDRVGEFYPKDMSPKDKYYAD